jgi:hypothetical protein
MISAKGETVDEPTTRMKSRVPSPVFPPQADTASAAIDAITI